MPPFQFTNYLNILFNTNFLEVCTPAVMHEFWYFLIRGLIKYDSLKLNFSSSIPIPIKYATVGIFFAITMLKDVLGIAVSYSRIYHQCLYWQKSSITRIRDHAIMKKENGLIISMPQNSGQIFDVH